MINTSGQDASLLQWNVTGPGGGSGGPTGGPSLLPESPPQAERQSKKEKSATTFATSVYICRSYISCVAPGPCTGRSCRCCCLVAPPISGSRPNTIQAIRRVSLLISYCSSCLDHKQDFWCLYGVMDLQRTPTNKAARFGISSFSLCGSMSRRVAMRCVAMSRTLSSRNRYFR